MIRLTGMITILHILFTRTVSPDIANRIVGGRLVSLGEFPFVVQIFVHRTKKHRCGGTILSPSIVITAAHCFNLAPDVYRETNAYRILAGDVKTINSNPPESRQVMKLKKIILHEDYDPMENLNDICLIKLREIMKISSNLASIRTSHSRPAVGIQCLILGWGSTSGYVTTIHLRMALIKIEKSKKCDQKFSRLHPKQFICAGDMSGNNDSCKGDSGGPLISGNFLVGIVSFGYPICGSPRYPAAYTDVAFYEKWIKRAMIAGRDIGRVCWNDIIIIKAVIFGVITAI